MGIPTCRFTDRQHEQFVCTICLDVAADPVATNNCDHIFCRLCLSAHKVPKCPTCQQNLQQPVFKPIQGSIKRIYLNLKIKCKNSKCNVLLDIATYPSHDDNCSASFSTCKDCGRKMKVGDFESHSCIQSLKEEMEGMKRMMGQMEKDLSSTETDLLSVKSNPVPVGFIYVQIPGQPEPKTLWSMVGWKDVTSEYAGLFFRAEGGGSEEFGTIQHGNAPIRYIDRIDMHKNASSYTSCLCLHLPGSGDSGYLYTGSGSGDDWFHKFHVTAKEGEVRPMNKAMRIWKRIQ